MGKYNSSETRVKPLAKAILADHSKLNKALSLLQEDLQIGTFDDANVYFTCPEEHKKEKCLMPTIAHSLSILNLIKEDAGFRESIRTIAIRNSKKEERKQLFDLNEDAFKKAREIIEAGRHSRQEKWAYFEGETRPDLFIENHEHIIIVEGKRTESHTTSAVEYLKSRSQMVRHIENAIEYCHGEKKVIAFYIVDAECNYLKQCEKDALIKELNSETITKTSDQIDVISSSFYGYTTWQAIGKKLNIHY